MEASGAVVADVEDRAPALVRVVVPDQGAGDAEGVVVAVGVDRTARPASGLVRVVRRVGAAPDGLVPDEHAVEHRPRDTDAAQARAVAAATTAERAAHDVHRTAVELRERADRSAAEVGAGAVAAVADEARVDDLELSAAVEDRPATAALGAVPGGVAVASVRCCTTRCGKAWSSQWAVVQTCRGSQVSW